MKTKLEKFFHQHNITYISCDSRNVKLGYAFFAIKGKSFDGNEFIAEALNNGAIVVMEEKHELYNPKQSKKSQKIPHYAPDNRILIVPNVRLALGLASGIIYPHLPLNIMAVTGTNGKTSVVSYIYQLLNLLGKKVAAFGTLGFKSNIQMSQISLNSLNTPDAINFRKILSELARNSIDNVAFEASSHGIHQHRIGDVKMTTAGFTSFSQDHLDYHQTMKEYLQVKLRLFTHNLEKNGEMVISSAILNSKYGNIVKEFLQSNKIKYCVIRYDNFMQRSAVGINHKLQEAYNQNDICITNLSTSLTLTSINFEYKGKKYQFNTNIIGSFQAFNLLIAAKMIENIGIDFEKIITILPQIKPVTGRLERAGKINDDFQIFIDYAHTPDALEQSLTELQKIKHLHGKLYLIFGCGGERDQHKRQIMGEVAQKFADYIIITNDNPRGENPAKIRSDILKGAPSAVEIAERKIAIMNTIANLKKNDILLIAGKGHEEYQIIGDKILPFSDIEIARKALSKC